MSDFSVYSREDVVKWLDYAGCISAVREAMKALSEGGKEQPLRQIIQVGEGQKMLALMPGVAGEKIGFGTKIISFFADPENPGRASHDGVVSLFDGNNGKLLAIADAHEVTKIRTGCASAVATDALARSDAEVLSVFGAGTQAESHIRAISEIRSLTKIIVWSRSEAMGSDFVRRLAGETGLPIEYMADPAEAAGQADIICTVTNSPTAVLLGKWVKPGTHINAVGSSYNGPVEVDSDLVLKSRYIADSRRSAMAEASEFLAAREAGLIEDSHMAGEIGEVLLGKVPGRKDADQITFYKSLGHIFQDLAAVAYIHGRAAGKGEHTS